MTVRMTKAVVSLKMNVRRVTAVMGSTMTNSNISSGRSASLVVLLKMFEFRGVSGDCMLPDRKVPDTVFR